MTDSQLLFGIMQNDEQVWRYIYREMKPGFSSIISQKFALARLSSDDIEDIYHQSLIVLMEKVKGGQVVVSREGALFSYLVQIGKFTACNILRKRAITISADEHKEEGEVSIDIDQKQQMQNEFLDRIFSLLPEECKALMKLFYWERKSMADIANISGMASADSAKSKKSKCMNKMRQIAAELFENDEFAEDTVRNAVERAALKELLEDERFYAQNGISIAALDIDDDNQGEQ